MIYQHVQHEKEMVLGHKDRPFEGQRPQERPKSFSACGSSSRAEVGWLQQPPSPPLSPSPSEVRARLSARALLCSAHSAVHLSLCCAHSTMLFTYVSTTLSRNIPAHLMLCSSLLSLFTNLLYATVYFLQQVWLSLPPQLICRGPAAL